MNKPSTQAVPLPSEADFTLEDLLIPCDTGVIDRPGGDSGQAGPTNSGAVSIFDEQAVNEAGSDFLRDYSPPPVYGSNIFDDRPGAGASDVLGAPPDESFVNFDTSPSKVFRTEDSLSGDELDQSSQTSNSLLEELDRPFPDALAAAWRASALDDRSADDGDRAEMGTDLFVPQHGPAEMPNVGSSPASTAEIDIPDALDWLGGPAPVADKPLDWLPAGSSPVPKPELRPGPKAARPEAPARARARTPGWLAPVGGVAVGATATALAFTLAPRPKPKPTAVVTIPAPASPGIDPEELARARAEVDQTRADWEQKLAGEHARLQSELSRRATADRARAEAERRLTAERERARTAANAFKVADATRARAEAELARLSAELDDLKVKSTATASGAAELVTNRQAADAARADLLAARDELAKADVLAQSAAQARSDLERKLADTERARTADRRALEAKFAEATRAREQAERFAQSAPTPARPAEASLDAESLTANGIELYSASRYAEAERVLATAAERGGDARAWYFLGFARFRQGQDPASAFARGVALERQGRPHARQVNQLLEGVDRAARAALGAVR